MENREVDFLDPKRILGKVIEKCYLFVLSIIFSLGISYLYTQSLVPIFQSNSLLAINEENNSLDFEIFNQGGLQKSNVSLQHEIVELSTFSMAYRTVKKLDFNVQFFQEGLTSLKEIPNPTGLNLKIDWDTLQLINAPIRVQMLSPDEYMLSQEEELSGATLYSRKFGSEKDEYQTVGNINPFQLKGKINVPLNSEFFNLTIQLEEGTEIPEGLFFQIIDDRKLANALKSNLNISLADPESTVLKLSFESSDRANGRIMLNTIMETYLENNLEIKNIGYQQTLEFIDEQLVTISDSLSNYENELELYRKINSITNLSEKGSIVLDEAVRLESELQALQAKLDYYNNLKDYLNDNEGKEIFVPSVAGVDDPLLNSLVTELLKLQTEKSSLNDVVNEGSFAYIRNLNARIEKIASNLNESVNNAVNNTASYLQRTENLLKTVEKDIGSLPRIERDLIKIERRYKLNESIYNYLLQKKAETEIEKASTTVKHRILDEAISNNTQIYPRPIRNYVLAISLGTSIPLLVIIISLLFNTKIVDIKEITELSEVPLIGTIPRMEEQGKDILLNDGKSPLTESFRSIRSTLALQYNFKNEGTILVTSAVAGEGKTYISTKIASIYASIGKKTILVGLDLRKPTLHKILDVTNQFGLTTYLKSDHTSIDSLIQPSGVANLDVLTAGPYFDQSYEKLNTPHFENLITSLKERYDFVVIDTSPIGLISETTDLIKYSDIILFVLRQNYSAISQLDLVNHLNKKVGLDNIFTVVNDVHKKGYGGYYYGYGYYYGNYQSYTQDEE
ncbi:tyrosine-protein kinase [uncultured Algoriphagus sp.]|uniref:GumC family protein n=1 Tax=uncultured Algoriphagus sp. TaxID=417365 RepID=UPI0025986B86|nr:tyrosine-protein kinase [uncultured Algoriphagus sp.]